jgi:hypothetical protein
MLNEVSEGIILNALDYHKYQGRWKPETRIAAVVESASEYFEELKMAHGKQILSPNDSVLIHSIVMSLQSNGRTAEYLRDSEHIDVYFQVPIYFNIKGVPCKALLDILRVDRQNKTLEPIDLKTMGGFTAEFPWAVRSRRYDFQAAFYSAGLNALVHQQAECEPLEVDVAGYQVKAFKFIVETTHTSLNKLSGEFQTYTGKPLCFRVSQDMLYLGKAGRPECVTIAAPVKIFGNTVQAVEIKHKPIHGYIYALDLHTWHNEHGFDEDRHVADSPEGVILLE